MWFGTGQDAVEIVSLGVKVTMLEHDIAMPVCDGPGVTTSSTMGRQLDHTGLPERINRSLATFLDHAQTEFGEPGPINEVFRMVREFVLGPGKRLRSLFCYWGWRGAAEQHPGVSEQTVLDVAASLELFHAFALIHDDIMDASDTRRGHPSLHRSLGELHQTSRWPGAPDRVGPALAILAGDLCLVWSDQLVDSGGCAADRWPKVRSLLHRMRTELVIGQYLDLLGQDSSVADALRIIRLKSGKYSVERPLHLGALLAGAGHEVLRAYTAFALPLGEAFQLRDDLLGVFGDPAVTGKSVMDDLREGKPTVLMALTRQQATPAQATQLGALYGNPRLDADGAATLRKIITASGARDEVESMITRRTSRALTALDSAPITIDAHTHLSALAHAATTRAR
jgi:geranylgeranyl diphosphate synthase, type I